MLQQKAEEAKRAVANGSDKMKKRSVVINQPNLTDRVLIERSLKNITGNDKNKFNFNEPASCNPDTRLINNNRFKLSPGHSNKASTEIETELIQESHISATRNHPI